MWPRCPNTRADVSRSVITCRLVRIFSHFCERQARRVPAHFVEYFRVWVQNWVRLQAPLASTPSQVYDLSNRSTVTNHAAIVPLTTAAAISCAWRISVLRGRCAISASGDSNDYVVLDGGRVIGRVMLHPQAPEAIHGSGRSRRWSIRLPSITRAIQRHANNRWRISNRVGQATKFVN